jgi:hypothetical protein
MINYSAIADRPNQKLSPWRDLRLSILIILVSFAILGVGNFLYTHYQPDETTTIALTALLLLGLFVVTVILISKTLQPFGAQKKQMKQFATDNGWKYDGSRRRITALQGFPSNVGVTPELAWTRSTVSGLADGIPFELAHITFLQRVETIYRVISSAGKYRFGWFSFIRLEGQPPLHESPSLLYCREGNYTYVICRANALYSDDVKAMFTSFTT